MINMDGNEREMTQGFMGILCDRAVSCELSGDFTLPEGQPEVRRILSVSENVLPPAKYVSSAGVECNGCVDYRVLYVGVDGGLWSASFSSEYELDTAMDDTALDTVGGIETVISLGAEGAVARVSSPKRINIKSRVSGRIRAYATIDTELDTYGDVDIESVERRYGRVDCAKVCVLSSDVLELSEEIGGLSEDSRVISAYASLYTNDLKKSSEGLLAEGEIFLKLLVGADGQRVESVTKKLPFSGLLECDCAADDRYCRVYGVVTDISVNVEEGRAICSLSAVLSAVAEGNVERMYMADVYSVERECVCETEEIILPVVKACGGGNFSQNERIALSDTGIPEGAELIDLWGTVRFDGCEYGGGKYNLAGSSKYTALWEKDGEYGCADIELPVKYAIDGEEDNNYVFDARGEVISCRGRIDGELFCLDAEIGTSADAFGRTSVATVRTARFGTVFGREKNRMVIYYPAEGESVWDVAKKYHVRADSLTAEKNYYLF